MAVFTKYNVTPNVAQCSKAEEFQWRNNRWNSRCEKHAHANVIPRPIQRCSAVAYCQHVSPAAEQICRHILGFSILVTYFVLYAFPMVTFSTQIELLLFSSPLAFYTHAMLSAISPRTQKMGKKRLQRSILFQLSEKFETHKRYI